MADFSVSLGRIAAGIPVAEPPRETCRDLWLGPVSRHPGSFQNFLFQFLALWSTFQKPFPLLRFRKSRKCFGIN